MKVMVCEERSMCVCYAYNYSFVREYVRVLNGEERIVWVRVRVYLYDSTGLDFDEGDDM